MVMNNPKVNELAALLAGVSFRCVECGKKIVSADVLPQIPEEQLDEAIVIAKTDPNKFANEYPCWKCDNL